MPNRSSNGRSRIAAASFVFALAAAVGSFERQAYADEPSSSSSPSKTGKDGKEKKDKDKQASDDSAKKEEKKEDASKKEGTDGAVDTSVESPKAIYISGDLAATRADLGGISDKTGFDRTVANGVLYGLSAGVRLKDLRFGARWRVYDTTEFDLWSVALSAGYGLPLRPLSPIFSAHVGYVFDQRIQEGLIKNSIPAGTLLPPDVNVKGLLVGVDVNASYWVSAFLRLGLFIGADAMFLNREKVDLPRSIVGLPPETAQNPLYSGSGSSIGLNFNVGLRGAFDIAFK